MTRSLLCVLLLVVAACVAAQSTEDSDLENLFPKSAIVIEADAHRCYHFDVYLAKSFELQRRGLMYVRNLPRMTGMLFIYAQPGVRSMWMKNTYISLDMLFIRADGSVESIAKNTEPLSLASISSGEPVVYVLELNAGVTEELQIGSDSRVHF